MGGEDCGLGGGGQRRGEDLARLRSPTTDVQLLAQRWQAVRGGIKRFERCLLLRTSETLQPRARGECQAPHSSP